MGASLSRGVGGLGKVRAGDEVAFFGRLLPATLASPPSLDKESRWRIGNGAREARLSTPKPRRQPSLRHPSALDVLPFPAAFCFEDRSHSLCYVEEMSVSEARSDGCQADGHAVFTSKSRYVKGRAVHYCPCRAERLSSFLVLL